MKSSIGEAGSKYLWLVFWFLTSTPSLAQFIANSSNHYPPQVKRIIDNRCVVCHGCYSSPCNLKLDTMAGLERGASPLDMYGTRPFAKLKPNRLFQDAQTLEQWRSEDYQFHSVHLQKDGSPSILEQLLEARHYGVEKEGSKSKKPFVFDAENSRSCPKDQKELDAYLKDNGSLGGMPYGMAPLAPEELKTLLTWVNENQKEKLTASIEDEFAPSQNAMPMVKKIETFLNRTSLKEQLVARYLYEHLFSAHLQLEGTATREFYRLVRADTLRGHFTELATRRPYDRPAAQYFYRLKKVPETIVQKNHTPFVISQQILDQWQNEFLDPNWSTQSMPKFGPAGANPFTTFHAIPAKARYRFFLNNAYYFIRSFIHGPVCNGQGATNVIRDHFWVFMLDPSRDLLSNNPEFEKEYGKLLDLPASLPDTATRAAYRWKNLRYQIKAAKAYQELWNGNLRPEFLWNGDRVNKNAAQTVYRHFKSAGVYDGLVGSFPQTIWVMDYSIFERIYYDLVAGFDVYGNSFHKITTRLYKDLLRTEAEDMYLSMLPTQERKILRTEWNHGFGSLKRIRHPFLYADNKVATNKNSHNHASRMYQTMQKLQGTKVVGDFSSQNTAIKRLTKLMGKKGGYPRYFPEVSLIRLKQGQETLGLTLLANKYRPFANSLVFEVKNPENDVLNLIEGLDVTHANLYFDLNEEQLDDFIKEMQAINSPEDWKNFQRKFAVSRLAENFWELSDWIQEEAVKRHPLRGGIIDLTRYEY